MELIMISPIHQAYASPERVYFIADGPSSLSTPLLPFRLCQYIHSTAIQSHPALLLYPLLLSSLHSVSLSTPLLSNLTPVMLFYPLPLSSIPIYPLPISSSPLPFLPLSPTYTLYVPSIALVIPSMSHLILLSSLPLSS